MRGNDYYPITLKVVAKTDNAILLSDGYIEEWVPISQMLDVDPEYFEIGDEEEFEIKEWILLDKGFI